jgi:N-acylneuraminate cytidylyltransferase
MAVITARGGSKRIPRKNIRSFRGKPLICYSIHAALESNLFDAVIVSTDDEEVATAARQAGASVPFMRSAENSDDYATTVDVLLEVIHKLDATSDLPDTICCIYPTAPFLTSTILIESLAALEKSGADKLVPVTDFAYPIQRALCIDKGRLKFREPQFMLTRSQDLEPQYHDIGQFYWFYVASLLADNRLVCEQTVPFEVDPMFCQDIDNPRDWELAEFKFDYLKSKGLL